MHITPRSRLNGGAHLGGIAILLLTVVAGSVAARADAVSDQNRVQKAISDQKKAYKAIGIQIPHPPALCNLLSKDEVEKFLGERVSAGESAGPVSGCAWRAADGSNDGLLVTRGSREEWKFPTSDEYHNQVKKVSGVGEQAYTENTVGLGYSASGRAAKSSTDVLISGKKSSAATAINILRVVIKR